MDEETLRKEFEEWAAKEGYFIELDRRGYYRADDTRAAFEAWLESYSSADKRAKANVMTIISDDTFAVSFQSLGQYRSAVIKAIRATIKEE